MLLGVTHYIRVNALVVRWYYQLRHTSDFDTKNIYKIINHKVVMFIETLVFCFLIELK
jgi:hypothetical protein